MLQRGDTGDAVKNLQTALMNLGFLSAEDMASGPGTFGPRTEKAVTAFKATMVDGIADDGTLAQLDLTVEPSDQPTSQLYTNAIVDLSHYNTNPDFAQAAAAGLMGVIHKATEGVGYTDDTYASNRQKARAAGLLWGAYHFGTGSDPIAQADYFLEKAAPDGDTLLVLDFESKPTGTTMTLEQAITFIERIVQVTGKYPGFYSGHDIKKVLGNNRNETLARCWFWLAQYGNTAVVPPNWPHWTLWQYTDGDKGPEPHVMAGIGPCDRDQFNGSAEQLHAFWQSQVVSVIS